MLIINPEEAMILQVQTDEKKLQRRVKNDSDYATIKSLCQQNIIIASRIQSPMTWGTLAEDVAEA